MGNLTEDLVREREAKASAPDTTDSVIQPKLTRKKKKAAPQKKGKK
jgi:hypothetical protein